MTYDAIILGAGAAGLMCAAKAGQRGRRVLLIEHSDAPGKKILISGGGRCNFTNMGTSAERFISKNPHFAKSALGRYRPEDSIALVDAHGIAWHEKTLGQLFCDGSARQIVAMLLAECPENVTLKLGESVSEVAQRDGLFDVRIAGRGLRGCAAAAVASRSRRRETSGGRAEAAEGRRTRHPEEASLTRSRPPSATGIRRSSGSRRNRLASRTAATW